MQLYFVRHAQSENNQMWRDTGSSSGRSADPEITRLGHRQAQRLADFIHLHHPVVAASHYDEFNTRGIGLTHLYTSLMTRAIQTGNAVAEKIDLPLVGLPDAHECGGVYSSDEETGEPVGLPGKTPQELTRLSPRLVLPEINPDGWWNREFEAREERLLRGKKVLKEILEIHGDSDDRIAIFSHAAFFNFFMTAVLSLEERPPVWFYLNNTGISRIDFDVEGPVLLYNNRTEHLSGELLT